MNKGIGITERGDAGLDFSWRDKVHKYKFSIIITKDLNDEFIQSAIEAGNVIVHAGITGYGGSVMEPNVPKPTWSLSQLEKLIGKGFPLDRLVARIDPIFPTIRGKRTTIGLVSQLSDLGIRRIRYSYVDLYGHVLGRFRNAGIKVPDFSEEGFMKEVMPQYPGIRFESCAEGIETDVGCISPFDFEIFGISPDIKQTNPQNRQNCKCLACKTELLNNKNNKRCPHQCLYCYWKD